MGLDVFPSMYQSLKCLERFKFTCGYFMEDHHLKYCMLLSKQTPFEASIPSTLKYAREIRLKPGKMTLLRHEHINNRIRYIFPILHTISSEPTFTPKGNLTQHAGQHFPRLFLSLKIMRSNQ
jgi:hypothetical protein